MAEEYQNDASCASSETNSKQVTKIDFRMGSFGATVPMIFFILWAILISKIILGVSTVEGLIVGAVIGLALGMFLSKSSWHDYAQAVFDGMSQSVGVVAIVAWFWAGMFASVLQAGGLVNGLVWLGTTTGLQGGFFAGITFILAAVFATAVGTGYGTTVAFCTLMYPAGVALGSDPTILFAAILSGAVFGDNMAPVSDTTIVSAVTQETDVPGVVRSRFRYAILAAIPTLILFLLIGGGGTGVTDAGLGAMEQKIAPNGLILIIPFALVIYLALSGRHLITSLTWGILLSVVFIPLFGLGAIKDILWFSTEAGSVQGAIYDGVIGYVPMAVLILMIVAAGYLIQVGGTMDALRVKMREFTKGIVKRVEVVMWGIVCLLNAFITINTAAEIAAAPFIREIGKEAKLHPYRRANFLDALTSALGYIFPWSGGVLLGVATINGMLNDYPYLEKMDSTSVAPFVFHGWILIIVMLVAALTGYGRRYEGPGGEELKEAPK
jgi:Na+/H+ antiporter NhaC